MCLDLCSSLELADQASLHQMTTVCGRFAQDLVQCQLRIRRSPLAKVISLSAGSALLFAKDLRTPAVWELSVQLCPCDMWGLAATLKGSSSGVVGQLHRPSLPGIFQSFILQH